MKKKYCSPQIYTEIVIHEPLADILETGSGLFSDEYFGPDED